MNRRKVFDDEKLVHLPNNLVDAQVLQVFFNFFPIHAILERALQEETNKLKAAVINPYIFIRSSRMTRGGFKNSTYW